MRHSIALTPTAPRPRPIPVRSGEITPPRASSPAEIPANTSLVEVGPMRDRPLVVSIVFMAILFTISAFAQVAPVRIAAQSQAIVGTEQVTLGDVAQVETLDADLMEALSEIPLVSSPRLGQRRSIARNLILSQLQRAGFDTADWQLDIPAAVILERESQTLAESDLEEQLRELLLDALPHPSHRTLIDNVRVPREAVLPPGHLNWEVELTGQRREIGSVGLDLIARQNGEVVGRFPCSAQVDVEVSVVTANMDIPRGAIITREMLAEREDTAGNTRRGTLFNMDEVIGMAAARSIREGDSISERHVERPRLVHRGDPVTVIYQTAGLLIQDTAVAMQDGAAGDLVAVQNTDTRHSYQALVTGERTVRVITRN